MTQSYAETLRPTTSDSTTTAPDGEAPFGITSAPALNGNPVGERVELARYTVSDDGTRILYGQRIDGVVRVTDVPASGHGRAVLVERGLELDGYEALRALVADYIHQAELHDEIPMLVSLLDTGTRSAAFEGTER